MMQSPSFSCEREDAFFTEGMCRSHYFTMMKLLSIGYRLSKVNGCYWLFLYVLYWLIRRFVHLDIQSLYKELVHLEEKHNLPGFNTPETAGDIWDLLPWEKERGEEWTTSAGWKKSLVDDVLLKYIKPGTTILEIGSGAGRWTEILQPLAKELIAVDVSSRAIGICRKRFASAANTKFFLNRNADLEFIPDKTIDAIWSYDVFVHMNPGTTDRYLSEFKRVLVPGGIAVIHHPVDGGKHGGSRSRMTGELFSALLEKHKLTILHKVDSWGENGQYNLSRYCDSISVFIA